MEWRALMTLNDTMHLEVFEVEENDEWNKMVFDVQTLKLRKWEHLVKSKNKMVITTARRQSDPRNNSNSIVLPVPRPGPRDNGGDGKGGGGRG